MSGAKRVLIIEDNPVNMELAADLLEAAGYGVLSAETAEEGIRLAQAQRPDLVLMDIALPGMDGLTATGVLLADPRTQAIPVVALTAHAMKGDEDRALVAGCVGYITKPINTRSFTRLVSEFAAMRPAAPVDATPVPTPAAPDAPAAPAAPAPAVPALRPFDDEPPIFTVPPAPAHALPAAEDEELLPLPAAVPTPPPPGPPEAAAPALPVVEDSPTDPSLPSWDRIQSLLDPTPLAAAPADPAPALSPATAPPSGPSDSSGFAAPLPPFLPALPSIPAEPDLTPPALPAPPAPSPLSDKDPARPAPPPAPLLESEFALPAPPPAPPVEPLSMPRPTSYLPKLGKPGRKPRTGSLSAEEGRRASETPRVLVVDDDPLNREVLADTLQALGCEAVLAEDGFDALEKADDSFDLILLDVMMPGMDGCQTLQALREEMHLTDIPIIMVTALSSREDRLRAVEVGASDFVTKPVDRTELRVRMASLLKMKAAQDALRKHQRDLEETVKQRTADLRKALQQLTRAQSQEHTAHLDTMHRLALAAEFRDGATAAAHIRCVGNYCAAIARGLGLPGATIETLLHAAPIHDIGMLGVPEAIALKRAEDRSPDEEAIYRHHTVLGARLLSGSQAELLRAGETIAMTHHECWDGSGFPHGLQGEQIPLLGRVCAVADAFDGLTSYRPGVEAYTNDEAKEFLASGRGKEFDPRVVDAFFARWEEVEQFQRQFRRTEAPPADLRPPAIYAAAPR